jgi:iron complex transport system ATP-binding protein
VNASASTQPDVAAVAVRRLTVHAGGREIVRDVTLDVGAGGWLTLIGPNGAGKTTVLRAIAGLLRYEGEVAFDGVPSNAMTRRARARRVAYVPQRPVLPPAMTVSEYVLLGRTPYIGYFDVESATDLDIAREALTRLEVETFAERPLGSLSGGEQQRVVLARALAQRAPVLLLDEGTSALDIGGGQRVLELVDGLRADGIAVISAMHDLTLSAQYAQRFAFLAGGSVVASGSAREVLRADLIASHYGADVAVRRSAAGITVTPVRRAR